MHRLAFGDFELLMFSDGGYYLDGGAMFGIVPKPLWEKKLAADERNRVRLGLNTLVIRTGRHTVLVETGIGDKLSDKMRSIYENECQLMDSLAAGGIAPDEVDVVINTHLHFDHCGWNTQRKGDRVVATFPNAKYYVQAGELQHARRQHERDRVSYISDNYDPLVTSGQMQLLYGDQDIVPGVSVKVYPGHTRNLQAVVIKSQNQKACYISDLIPTSAHTEVVWGMAYDLFPLENIESRKRFYEVAIPEKWLVIYTHDPKTPWTYLATDAKGKVVPVPVEASAPAGSK